MERIFDSWSVSCPTVCWSLICPNPRMGVRFRQMPDSRIMKDESNCVNTD